MSFYDINRVNSVSLFEGLESRTGGTPRHAILLKSIIYQVSLFHSSKDNEMNFTTYP
jgi:hypothetical protein